MPRCHPMQDGLHLSLLLLLASPIATRHSRLAAQSLATRADSIFTPLVRNSAPGCAIAIDSAGRARYRGAFGKAELEYGIPIDTATIFEAGSVSKQFTAAAVLLLAARGTLSLDDPVQKWFPEIPEYSQPIMLRHLLLHSSGLRDWGAVASLAGWPRGQRAHTQDDALAIIARQRGLNHQPGAAFSYTNTGYNLLAMLVGRASGVPFAEFTRREFFEPLGMRHTSWRDDFTRVVPHRAQAYAMSRGAWVLDMPFEDVHGNGGLLTTVGDLLTWNRALGEGRIGRPDVSAAMKTAGRFNDGNTMPYGGGLFLGALRGVPAIWHTGATAGYRAILATFPEQRVAIAMLCNRGDANPGRLAEQLLDGVVPFAPPVASAPQAVTPAYRADPTRLGDYAGRWYSAEADGIITFRVQGGALQAARRPGQFGALRATALDEFAAPGGVTLRFERDASGRPVRLYASVDRARDVRFEPEPDRR